jgi:hypothetical protein
MKHVILTPVLCLFNLPTLVEIFKKTSGLEDGCYDLFEIKYEDGSFLMCFNYPTDFDEKQAKDLVDEISDKVADEILQMSLITFENFLKED